MSSMYDVAVIGAGPGGYVAAVRAAQLGGRVAVIEKAELGGVCLNWGCIPTKTLIYAGELFKKLKKPEQYGISADNVRLNLDPLMKRKEQVVRGNRAAVKNLFTTNGIDHIQGEAQLTGPKEITVNGEIVRANSVIIATGSSSAGLPGIALDGKRVITSTEALELRELPERIAVIGAGAIGMEFASLWNIWGAKMTVLELMPRILPLEDEEVSAYMHSLFKKRGMDIRVGTMVSKLDARTDGIKLTLEGEHPGTVDTDLVLVAVGRRFHSEVVTKTPGLGVEVTPRGAIIVNERMETTLPGVYAIGDVTAKTLLAHGASNEGLIAAANAMGGNKQMDYRVIPACTFTSPEVAHVGMTEAQARATGRDIHVGRFGFSHSGRAFTMADTEGFAKIIGDAGTDEVLGVHICGPEAGELIAPAALAMRLEATVEELFDTVYTHPTLSEVLMEAAGDYFSLGIHTPPKRG
ncbi:MAG: dihydrolipoyl dehydrogenase [Candidatus Hydrogenedentota bacterium]